MCIKIRKEQKNDYTKKTKALPLLMIRNEKHTQLFNMSIETRKCVNSFLDKTLKNKKENDRSEIINLEAMRKDLCKL